MAALIDYLVDLLELLALDVDRRLVEIVAAGQVEVVADDVYRHLDVEVGAHRLVAEVRREERGRRSWRRRRFAARRRFLRQGRRRLFYQGRRRFVRRFSTLAAGRFLRLVVVEASAERRGGSSSRQGPTAEAAAGTLFGRHDCGLDDCIAGADHGGRALFRLLTSNHLRRRRRATARPGRLRSRSSDLASAALRGAPRSRARARRHRARAPRRASSGGPTGSCQGRASFRRQDRAPARVSRIVTPRVGVVSRSLGSSGGACGVDAVQLAASTTSIVDRHLRPGRAAPPAARRFRDVVGGFLVASFGGLVRIVVGVHLRAELHVDGRVEVVAGIDAASFGGASSRAGRGT